jgi:hypothetical protein
MMDVEELLPEVMVHARSVPEPVALRFIRQAARELCKRAKFWAEWEQITITGDDEGEGISTIQDAIILEVESAQLTNSDGGKYVLEPVTPQWLDKKYPRWKYDFDETAAPGRFVTQIKPNTVMVLPKDTGVLDVRLILLPARNAFTLPDFLVEDHSELIAKGAAGMILVLPETEYTNPQLGAYLTGEFNTGLDNIAITAQRTQFKARPRTKASYF